MSRIFDRLEHLFQCDITNSFNEIRKILNLAKKNVLKEIAFHILERDTFTFHENRFQWYHYILDIIDTKFFTQSEVTVKTTPKNVVTVEFINKGFNDIHLGKILRLTEVISLLPDRIKKEDELPNAAWKLRTPICNKILNYKHVVSSLYIDDSKDISSFFNNLPPCDCHNSDFCDPNHKHIVTGDLRIISNDKLR